MYQQLLDLKAVMLRMMTAFLWFKVIVFFRGGFVPLPSTGIQSAR